MPAIKGESPLIHLAVMRLLIQHDFEAANIKDEGECFLLHWACSYNAPTEVKETLIDLIVDALLAPCDGPGGSDGKRGLPLHLACKWADSSFDTFQLLLNHCPEATRERDLDGCLPLHHALTNDAVPDDVIMSLLDVYPEGARVEDKIGNLLLHFSFSRQTVCCRLVKMYPESARRADADGDLPLQCACFEDECTVEVVKLLYEEYPEAICFGGRYMWLPLHCVLDLQTWRDERTAIVEFLIDKYPQAVQSANNFGKLPIHLACSVRGLPTHIIQLLLDHYQGEAAHSSGLCVAGDRGRIPLHDAAEQTHLTQTVQLLLKRCPEGVQRICHEGMLPLHLACARRFEGCLETIWLLLEVDLLTILVPCRDGRTALQLAFDTRRHDAHTLETKRFLVDKQDEALQAMDEGLRLVSETYGLPELVIAEIRRYVVLPRLWRPTEQEYPRVE